MPGCPKHTKGLVLKCPQCKKINNQLTKVAKDTVNGRKIQYFHPFKKEDIQLKIQQLADEAKAQEASPFCVRHFPQGGVRCHACLARQMTEDQFLHRDTQAALFGLPLPIRPEEVRASEAMLADQRREHASQTMAYSELVRLLRTCGYSIWSVEEFTAGLFSQCDPDKTGVVFLHDIAQYSQVHPPRLLQPLILDGAGIQEMNAELAAIDTDKSGGISRGELEDVLFMHGMQPDHLKTYVENFFLEQNVLHPEGELSLANVYSAFMQRHRKVALVRLKKACLSLFQIADEDKDGQLSLQEVRLHHMALLGGTVHRAAVDDTFTMINVSKTGFLTPNELFSYYYQAAGLYNVHDIPQLYRIDTHATPQPGAAQRYAS